MLIFLITELALYLIIFTIMIIEKTQSERLGMIEDYLNTEDVSKYGTYKIFYKPRSGNISLGEFTLEKNDIMLIGSLDSTTSEIIRYSEQEKPLIIKENINNLISKIKDE